MKKAFVYWKIRPSVKEILKENQYSCVWYGSNVAEEWNEHFDEFVEIRNHMMDLYAETWPDIRQRFFVINSSNILNINPHTGPLIHLYYSNLLVANDLYTLATSMYCVLRTYFDH